MHADGVLIELGAIVVVLGLLGRLAERIGLSPIPLYLLGGLAFGQGGLLPLVTATEFIEVGAEIGVVLLLLTLGLEYTPSELLGNLRKQAPVAVLDLLVNAAPGVVAALLMGGGPVAALAFGGITAVSSSGIIAKSLVDLERLGNRETPIILSILVLEDLAMAVYLPVLTAALAGATAAAGATSAALGLAALAVVFALALRWGEAVSRIIFTGNREILLLCILGFALLVAGVAERVQISAAVGAFLVGIALSGRTAEGARDLLEPLRDLFAAVFFVFFGLQTDPSTLPAVALPALALAVWGIATKVLTGWYAAGRAGIGTRGRVRAGMTLVARGEFSIVIAGLLLAAGVAVDLAPLAVCYVLILAVLGPIAARAADPVGRLLVRWQDTRVLRRSTPP